MRTSSLALLSLAGAASGAPMRYELEAYEPLADPSAVVIAGGGSARFTVLTDRLVRMEYAKMPKSFEDRATLAFVNRRQPVPKFKWDGTTLTTSSLVLSYKGGPFSPSSLGVRSAPGVSPPWSWTYGETSASDPGNLRGTFRTLDGIQNLTLDCEAAKRAVPSRVFHCEWGVVSSSGWALVDESGVPVLDGDDWWTDEAGKMLRSKDALDLYLFGHGHDYLGALSDLSRVGGRVPLVPRANLGVWWTRWYDFDATDVAALPDAFEARTLPLDVLVLDMNWHSKQDWTGYTWDPSLYPRPAETMRRLHEAGLVVAANLHDADGIGTWEDSYADVCEALGLPPPSASSARVNFTLVNKSYASALQDITLESRLADGLDFWWIDWQQGESAGGTGQDGPRLKMNPTIWLNKMRVTDAKRKCVLGLPGCDSRRGVTFGRFGGLGNHRYQVGFSGDVYGLTWANLAYQAYFSATASNVGFGFWSHDLVGPGNDHEMYARWLQLGCYSSIMRMHDRGGSAGECRGWPNNAEGCWTVRPWNVPDAFYEANRDAMRTRAALVPYLYTEARRAYDAGVGLTRPMYYYWPEEASAYPESKDAMLGQTPGTRQYMFGEALLVAPVTAPADCAPPRGSAALSEPCGLTQTRVWLPPGEWFELHTGTLRRGPASLAARVHLRDVPVYARGGSLVARRPLGEAEGAIGSAAKPYAAIEWTLHPGAASGSAAVYEDDGRSVSYLAEGGSRYVMINASYAWDAAGKTLSLALAADDGKSFDGAPSARAHTFRLPCTAPPTSVTLDAGSQKAQLKFAPVWRSAVGAGSWTYDGDALETVVTLPPLPTSKPFSLTIATPRGEAQPLSSLRGAIIAARRAKAVLDQVRIAPGRVVPDPNGTPLNYLAMAGDRLSHLAGLDDPAAFAAAVGNVSALHAAATSELTAQRAAAKPTAVADRARLEYALQMLDAAAPSAPGLDAANY